MLALKHILYIAHTRKSVVIFTKIVIIIVFWSMKGLNFFFKKLYPAVGGDMGL